MSKLKKNSILSNKNIFKARDVNFTKILKCNKLFNGVLTFLLMCTPSSYLKKESEKQVHNLKKIFYFMIFKISLYTYIYYKSWSKCPSFCIKKAPVFFYMFFSYSFCHHSSQFSSCLKNSLS